MFSVFVLLPRKLIVNNYSPKRRWPEVDTTEPRSGEVTIHH